MPPHDPHQGNRCLCLACLLERQQWLRAEHARIDFLPPDEYLDGDYATVGSRYAYEWWE